MWRKDEQAHAADTATEDNYFWYDALQQVKERQRGDLTDPASPTPISDLQQQENLTFDTTGNWAAYSDTSPTNAQIRTHNTANEITEIASSPGDVEPDYDPAGNMLTLPKEPGVSTEQYDLVWDAWNRLVAVKGGDTTVASYTYDGLTRRLTKATADEVRHYYYNKDWRAVEERVEGASVAVDRQYVWGLRDRWDLVRRKRSVTGSLDEVLYVLRDYLDLVAIADASGDVVERYAYDTFGNVRFLAPDYSPRSASDFDWDFLFHGEFRDALTQLYNYGFRYYDTGLGRWLSRDPIDENGGWNLYVMAGNYVVNSQDYVGLSDFFTKIVAKSFINGVPVVGGWGAAGGILGDGSNQRLSIFAETIGKLAAFHQLPTDDTKDGNYRLYATVTATFCCAGTKLSSLKFVDGDEDGGTEIGFLGIKGTIDGTVVAQRISDSEVMVLLASWGMPNIKAEIGMQMVKPRKSYYIWNAATIKLSCATGKGTHAIVSFNGSSFPSRKLWINGVEKKYVAQGALSGLWTEDPTIPYLVAP